MITAQPPDAGDARAPDDVAAACRDAARRLRSEYRQWVVIWVARTGQFHAYRLASSDAGTGLTDGEPAGLAAQIEQAERAAANRRAT